MPAAKPPPPPSGGDAFELHPPLTRLLIEVGARLREAREARGMTQEELARRSGTARTYIGPVERGAKNVSLETLARFAAVLDVEMADLIPRREELRSPREDSGR